MQPIPPMPSRFVVADVRKLWLARPPARRRSAHLPDFGAQLWNQGTRVAATVEAHHVGVGKIVRPLVEPD